MAVQDIIQYSTTAGSNTTIDTTISTAENCPIANWNNAVRALMANVANRFGNTVSVVCSASSMAIGDQEEEYVIITGATGPVTSLGTPTVANKFGYWLKFSSTPTITHNATSNILPGGADYTMAAGDMAYVRHEGSGNWRWLIFPASGVGAIGGTTAISGHVLTANGSGSAPTWKAPAGGGYAAKTGNYTIISTDNGDVIDFTTAGFTGTLTAAATLGSGFTVTIANTASSGDVTIEPDGSETLDGLTNRLLRPGDRATIVCDGSNWKTVRGVYSYDSGAQTITTGGALTLAHGLRMQPELHDFRCELINVTDQHGFTTGQYLPTPLGGFTNGASNQWSFQPDATNLNLQYGSSSAINVPVRSTGTLANITLASWSFRVKVSIRY